MSEANKPAEPKDADDAPAPFGASELQQGAVAVIDALGFKGIWSRNDPGLVLETLVNARESARKLEEPLEGFVGQGNATIRFFSDGVVVTCTGPNPGASLQVVITTTAMIMAGALIPRVRLAYRGCISFGPILVRDEFFVGRAIDEAAEGAGAANAAVVWLTPNALAHFAHVREVPTFLARWDVPMKAGGALETLIVNPFPQFELSNLAEEEVIARCLGTFGESPPLQVAIKKQNTRRALEAARAAWRRRKGATK